MYKVVKCCPKGQLVSCRICELPKYWNLIRIYRDSNGNIPIVPSGFCFEMLYQAIEFAEQLQDCEVWTVRYKSKRRRRTIRDKNYNPKGFRYKALEGTWECFQMQLVARVR
jgi:hypothetical protein